MDGREKGSSRKSELLDWLFRKNMWLSIGIPLGIFATTYLLFLIFGDIYAAEDALTRPLLYGVLAFVAMFFVLGVQLLNPRQSPKSMDHAELFLVFSIGAMGAVWVLRLEFLQLFTSEAYGEATIVAELVGFWCGICAVHNMRR